MSSKTLFFLLLSFIYFTGLSAKASFSYAEVSRLEDAVTDYNQGLYDWLEKVVDYGRNTCQQSKLIVRAVLRELFRYAQEGTPRWSSKYARTLTMAEIYAEASIWWGPTINRSAITSFFNAVGWITMCIFLAPVLGVLVIASPLIIFAFIVAELFDGACHEVSY